VSTSALARCEAVNETEPYARVEPALLPGDQAAEVKWLVPLAAAALLLAVPVATWWLVGDQSTVPLSADPDYFIRPFRISPALERAWGLGSVLMAIAAGLLLTCASLRHDLDLRWWSVLGPLLAVGVLIGFGWRVFTAGVIGANIGAGLLTFFVGPIIAALLAWAVFRSVTLLR
jgi:hypothetical protein